MRRLWTAVAAATLLAAPVAGSARTQSTKPLLGLVSIGQESWKLAPVDPLTLAPRPGRVVRVGSRISRWSFSPDRSKLVLADDAIGGTLMLVDTRAMRSLGRFDVGGFANVLATFWPVEGRVYTVVTRLTRKDDGTFARHPSSVIAVDPSTRALLGERSLGGWVYSSAHGAGVLALLLGRETGVGPASLAVLGADGSIKAVSLDGVQVGYDAFDQADPRAVGHYARPGLAVARDGSRAFVVSPGQVAAVDLRTLEVSYHRLGSSRRRLQRVEKGALEGSTRFALWARDGELLVTGSDDGSSVGTNGFPRTEPHPIGLQIVDTRDWSTTTIDPMTSWAVVGSNAILAMSSAWDPKQGRVVGRGATIYGLGGVKRAHLFGAQDVGGVVVGRRAFVVGQDSGYTIVSTTTGRILRKIRHQLPQPLLGAAQDN